MFFMMPYWHIYGKQNLSNEAYQTTAPRFQAKVDEMVTAYKVGEMAGIPIVKPPAPGTGERSVVPVASIVDGLEPWLLITTGKHQPADRARL
jgi:hypothetical protein